MPASTDSQSAIRISGTAEHFLDLLGSGSRHDYAGGIARSSLLARLIVTGVLAPGIGPTVAGVEPKPVMRAVLRGGLGNTAALHEDYVDELLKVGRRPGHPVVARAVYGNPPSLMAARDRYPEVSAPVHLIYGERDWSRPSDREANRQLLPAADFIQVPGAGHFIALERPDVPAKVLNDAMRIESVPKTAA